VIDWAQLYNGDSLADFANLAIFNEITFELLGICFLALMRIVPIIASAPFLGAKIIPMPVKIIEGISLLIIFLPTIMLSVTTKLVFNETMLLLAAKEFLIGFILGFFVSIPFSLMQSVGTLIDHQRGSASLMVNDPSMQNQVSPLGLFFNYILIYLFYISEGPFHFFDLINTSFTVIPIDKFLSPVFFHVNTPFFEHLIPLLNHFVTLTVQLAAPSLIIILMTDFFLGIANRLAPQVQIIFLGMGLKSTIPLVVIALGWTLFLQEAMHQTELEENILKQTIIELGANVRK
jgi:type III secretory pathway component EscT